MIVPLCPDDAERLRDVCRAANYTEANLLETLGTEIPPPPHHPQAALFAELTDRGTPFHCLARLFFLGISVPNDEAEAVLPSWLLSTSLACGLLERAGGVVRPLALLVPQGQRLLAADLLDTKSRSDDGYVPTLNQPAMHLLAFSIRRPVRAMLDLCGGFALHGIVASEFSESVVSSDLNVRAKLFAEFNAALNGCDNLEAVTGDLFEPVEGRKFDLILCNPPFVISPAASASYRDNPLDLDSFLQEMLDKAPDHLEEGGFFQTTCEWVEVAGEDWRDRLGQWVDGCGCDVWVLHANRQLPASYAEGRLRESTDDPDELASGKVLWDRYFEDRKVEAIYGGLIFLRRREGANWFDITEVTKAVTEPISDMILQGFASRDLLHSSDRDAALLASRLHVAPGVKQEEVTRWENNTWQLESISLRLESGLPVTIGIDAHVRKLVSRFDGESTVERVLHDFAEHVGIPVESARVQGLQMVRLLVEHGFLVLP